MLVKGAIGRISTPCTVSIMTNERKVNVFLYILKGIQHEKIWGELYLHFSMLGDSAMMITTLYLLDPPLCWNATLIGVYNGVGFMIKVSAAQWWCDDMETSSSLLALFEENPLVIASFLHKGGNKADLWCFLYCYCSKKQLRWRCL